MTPYQRRLYELAIQYAPDAWAADDWPAVVTGFQTIVVQPNDSPVTYDEVTRVHGDNIRIMIANTIRMARDTYTDPDPVTQLTVREELRDGHNLMLDHRQGIVLNSQRRQDLIDMLSAAGKWETLAPGITEVIKQRGISRLPAWQHHGLDALPTALELSDAKAAKKIEDAAIEEQQEIGKIRGYLQTSVQVAMDYLETNGSTVLSQDLIDQFTMTLIGLRP